MQEKEKKERDNKVIGKSENENQAKRNEEEAQKKGLDFRKQWSATQQYRTPCIKHVHIKAPDCRIAILDIAQRTLLQMNKDYHETLSLQERITY